MISCKNRRLIGPYLDGQLGECRWLDEHICECSECLAEYESIQRIKHLVRRLDFSPPESFYWKNFPLRVSARIATRRTRSFINRIKMGLSARKFAVRILTPLLAILIAIFAIKIFYHGKWMPVGFKSNQADEQTVTSADYTGVSISPERHPDIEVGMPLAVGGGELLQQADTFPMTDNNLAKKPVEGESKVDLTYGVSKAVATAEDSSGNFEQVSDSGMLGILDNGYRQVGYTTANLVGADLNIIRGLGIGHLTGFSSDQVVKYQILAGSRLSMVPLSSYREAAGRFFAPKISVYSNTYNLAASSYWGFASGDNKYDSERLHRLMLELDLSREK